MDIQKQVAFEKFHAHECNCDYEELKRRLDRCEMLTGHRYPPTSPRHEAWLTWCAAWDAKTQAVPEWISVKNELPPENILVLGMSQTRSNIFNFYDVMALDEFDEADITHWMPLPDAPQEPANEL